MSTRNGFQQIIEQAVISILWRFKHYVKLHLKFTI